METDKDLIEIYLQGFNDELNNVKKTKHDVKLKQTAYDLGRLDAIVGDDVSSSDRQTNKQILDRIKYDK
jgi:hypothetical protein